MASLDALFDHAEKQSSLDELFNQAESSQSQPGHGMGDVKMAESQAQPAPITDPTNPSKPGQGLFAQMMNAYGQAEQTLPIAADAFQSIPSRAVGAATGQGDFGAEGTSPLKFIHQHIDESNLHPAAKAALHAATGYAEDPINWVTGGMGLAKGIGKAAESTGPAIKTALSGYSDIAQPVLQRAADQGLGVIKNAAETQPDIASELISKASFPQSGNLMKAESQAAKEAATKIPAVSVQKPMAVLSEAANQFAPTLEAKAVGNQIKGQLNHIKKAYNLDGSAQSFLSGPQTEELKSSVQKIVEGKYGKDNADAYDNVMKAFAYQTRQSLEDAAVKAGVPEYIDAMRSMAKKIGTLEKTRDMFMGNKSDAFQRQAETALSNIGSKVPLSKDRLLALQNFDKMVTESTGIESNLAEQAQNAYAAKAMGIQKGGSIPLTSIVKTGKYIAPFALGGFAFHHFGGGGVLGALGALGATGATALAMALQSPKGAARAYQAIDLAAKMNKSPQLARLISAGLKAGSADALARLKPQIDSIQGGQ